MSSYVDDESGVSRDKDGEDSLECLDETQEDIDHAIEEAEMAKKMEEEQYNKWKEDQIEEARWLESAGYTDEKGVQRTYVGRSHRSNQRRAQRIMEEVEAHEFHRQNPERGLHGPRLVEERERNKRKARDRELQEAKEREEEERINSARQRPPANDWYCTDRMEVTMIHDIIQRHNRAYTEAMRTEVATYINRFVSAVRTNSKITYWVRMADARRDDPTCRLYNSYSNDKELCAITAAATTVFVMEVSAKGKETKKEINPMQ